MKERIPRLVYFMVFPIGLLALASIYLYDRKQISDYELELKTLKSKEINGIILDNGHPNRGYSNFTVNDAISNSKLFYTLAITWFYEENNIQVNDSVSKTANSKIITFYKLKNSVYEECCEYEIEVE